MAGSKSATILAAAVATMLTAPDSATANATCAKRDKIITILALDHGEALAGRGMKDSEALFEIWHSEESGTWTILRTDARGTSCVMAAGTHWMPGPEEPAPSGTKG